MPRKSKVEVSAAIEAIYLFKDDLRDGILPPYTNEFYTNVAESLNNVWTRHQVYINLREDRRQLRSKVFEKIGVSFSEDEKEPSRQNEEKSTLLMEPNESENNDKSIDKDFKVFDVPLADGEQIFDFVIRLELWVKMKPITEKYNGRNFLVLPPRKWTDIIADEFWKQYRMPCAFTFKKHTVSLEEDTPYLRIFGKCKSVKCNNTFFASVNDKPKDDADLWLQVQCRDTRLDTDHEEVKRELHFEKRQDIGQMLLQHGAANTRRKIALKVQNIGDFPSPILYKGDVLRKLLQEVKDKELNVDAKEGNNPIFLLLLLKYRTPYCGSIEHISADKFQLQYLLPEQRYVFKEYCRIFSDTATICLDSTGSLVKKIELTDNIKSAAIFLYEIVINFNKTTLSVGQMLSAAQDTNSILYWLNNWLKVMKTLPKEAVSDYSKALLGGMSLAFNNMPLKTYIKVCFKSAKDAKILDRPAKTFIRVDVAHLIQIFCRLKCLTKCVPEIKDFFLRCIALMVSCDNFKRFETILLDTLIVSIHKYDGNRLNCSLQSPAEASRERLEQLIKTECHLAMDLIPDETSKEFNNSIKKLYASGFDPTSPDCFLNQEPEVDETILDWLQAIQVEAESAKDVKHSRVNAYCIPEFFKHLINLSKEFPLWTAVNRNNFKSVIIRATSSYSESEFKEVKVNILNNVHGSIRADKFFKIHFAALKAQALIASAEVAKVQTMEPTQTKPKKSSIPQSSLNSNIEDAKIAKPKMEVKVISSNPELKEDPILTFKPNVDLYEFDNWKNKGQPEITDTRQIEDQMIFEFLPVNNGESSELPSFNENLLVPKHESTGLDIHLNDELDRFLAQEDCKLTSLVPNSDLFELEDWKNRGTKEIQESSIPITVDAEKMPKKRTLEIITQRKPSKYFRSGADFKVRQKIIINSKIVNTKDGLLLNGNFFHQPICIADEIFMVKNTCSFDSILQILSVLAFDSPRYLRHVEEADSETFGFLLVFLESGAVNHVYGLRCLLLKNFNPNHNEIRSFTSPKMVRSIDVYCNITDMWEFLMDKQPSLFDTRMYPCGYLEVLEVPTLFVNHKIIESEGYKSLDKAIISRLGHVGRRCPKNDCGVEIKKMNNFKVNAQVYIETDVRKSSDLNASVMCKVDDFPLNINLHGEVLRFGGIIVHENGNHYMAICRRLNGHWELYNDCAKKVTAFSKKKKML